MSGARIIESPYMYESFTESSVYEALEKGFKKSPDKVAIVMDDADRTSFTYREVEAMALRVAYNLQVFGVKHGSIVGLFSSNTWQYAVMVIACFRLAATPCFISIHSKQGELNSSITMCSIDYLFVEEGQATMSLKASQETSVKYIFTTEPHTGCIPWSILDRDIPRGEAIAPLPHIDRWQDVAAIYFSSGTTGPPKAVLLRHCTMLDGLSALCSHEVKAALDITILYQPLAHVYGAAILVGGLSFSQTVIIMPRFHLDNYLHLIVEYKVTHLQLVPPVMVMMTKSDLVKQIDLSHVQSVIVGTAPITPALEGLMRGIMSNKKMKFRNAYGMSEGVLLCISPPESFSGGPVPAGSVGHPFAGCKLKVCDPETKVALGPGTRGELIINVPFCMKGYLNNQKATDEMLDSDGWLHTGDVGYYDEDGYIFVVDRLKELIKYNSFQVSPSELEGLLIKHPLVSDVGVTSIPDEQAGELPRAYIVREAETLTEKQVQDYISEQVSQYKRLRGGVRFVDIIPKSSNGKILRRIMKDQTLREVQSDSNS